LFRQNFNLHLFRYMVISKKLDQRSIVGQQGVNLVERVVLSMGWVWQQTGNLETGIDGIIEIRDSSTGETTNSIIQVQSKATANPFQAETDNGFEYLCDEKDLEYWLRGNAPVILVRSRPKTNEAYWIPIKDYFNTPEKRKSRKILFDKKHDRFDESCRSSLISMAVPRDAGIYFSPPPKKEILYSNLLKVSFFPDRIYAAESDFRKPNQVWEELNKHDKHISGVFFLKSKSILSFCNLGEHPWDKICKVGSLKIHDTSEWANSEDAEKRRDFVQLLNLCLRGMAHKLGLEYHKTKECYYFRPTIKLSQRSITYQSIAKNASRDVFHGYPNKRDPSRIAYYRHSAFEGKFVATDCGWYLQITPTYLFTSDGYRLAWYHEDNLKLIKQKEKNPAVLGQVIMWAEYLRPRNDLFRRKYQFLEIGDLLTFDIDVGIDDETWLPQEEEEERQELSAAEPGLFDR
jgi:hypothetical protein